MEWGCGRGQIEMKGGLLMCSILLNSKMFLFNINIGSSSYLISLRPSIHTELVAGCNVRNIFYHTIHDDTAPRTTYLVWEVRLG